MEAQVSSESEQRGNLSLREQSWLDERNDLRDEISSGTVLNVRPRGPPRVRTEHGGRSTVEDPRVRGFIRE